MSKQLEKVDALFDSIFGSINMFEGYHIRAPYSDACTPKPKTWIGYEKVKEYQNG